MLDTASGKLLVLIVDYCLWKKKIKQCDALIILSVARETDSEVLLDMMICCWRLLNSLNDSPDSPGERRE